MKGERIQISLKACHRRPASETPLKWPNACLMSFRWRDDDGPTLNAGLVASWFFRGIGPVLLGNQKLCDFSGKGS